MPNSSVLARPEATVRPRVIALIAGLSLLAMAVLAPFALFGVLGSIIVPGDATATVNNLIASEGLFRIGIAAFLIVIMLDLVVAWALYVLLRAVHPTLTVLTAWLRVAFAAVFASALISLLDVAQLVGDAGGLTLQRDQLEATVMASLASFDNGWTGIALSIFGLHLLGLGYLVARSGMFPFSKILGVLVTVSGLGYLVDSFAMILVAEYAWTIGMFAFVGEALLIVALLWRAASGFPSSSELATAAPGSQLASVAS